MKYYAQAHKEGRVIKHVHFEASSGEEAQITALKKLSPTLPFGKKPDFVILYEEREKPKFMYPDFQKVWWWTESGWELKEDEAHIEKYASPNQSRR